jgi:hypothetical protein
MKFSCPSFSESRSIISKKLNTTKKYVGIHYQLIEDKLNLVKLQKAKFLEHALQMELLRKKIDLVNKKLEKNYTNLYSL